MGEGEEGGEEIRIGPVPEVDNLTLEGGDIDKIWMWRAVLIFGQMWNIRTSVQLHYQI